MRDLTFPWSAPPEVQRIFDRAEHYRRDVYTSTGARPDRFFVTEDEYHLLQMYSGGPATGDTRDAIELFGMRVCCSERMTWYRDNRFMEHFKLLRRLGSSIHEPLSPISPLPLTPEICRTDRPLTPRREIPCPCGEVIWDLSSCTANDVPLGNAIRMARLASYGIVPFRAVRVELGLEEDNDPPPPLDDLDEGLQCCGKPYQTFAQFMAHRRQHGEG